jgi:hypothetical protein
MLRFLVFANRNLSCGALPNGGQIKKLEAEVTVVPESQRQLNCAAKFCRVSA